MDYILKSKTVIHAIFALSEILDVIINVLINVISQEAFSIYSKHNLITLGILVFCVAAHIAFGIIQHKASAKTKNKRFQRAFIEHGGYDVVAEEAKECIKNRDVQSLKDLRKMVDLLER